MDQGRAARLRVAGRGRARCPVWKGTSIGGPPELLDNATEAFPYDVAVDGMDFTSDDLTDYAWGPSSTLGE